MWGCSTPNTPELRYLAKALSKWYLSSNLVHNDLNIVLKIKEKFLTSKLSNSHNADDQ